MLSKFEVSGFKGFNENMVFDLSDVKNYTFNDESVRENNINKSIIYGGNGTGKTNLGLAIFDIVRHLTDKEFRPSTYANYLNAANEEQRAKFRYSFFLKNKNVVYEYVKLDYNSLVSEKLIIEDEVVLSIDRNISTNSYINLKGAETLKTDIGHASISILSYVKNNAVLDDNPINQVFFELINFVNKMLFFRIVEQANSYIFLGLNFGEKSITSDIIESGKLPEFEKFLNASGIKCKLSVYVKVGEKRIAFDFGKRKIDFFENASTGTKALSIFYFWLQRIKNEDTVSFVFIDEFDAYYHHDLSKMIVKELKKTSSQVVLTTHNTSIMTNDLLRPDCYFVMTPELIKPICDLTSKEIRQAHNLEKMYKAGVFQEYEKSDIEQD
jgi:AAA15 family ATPase/GTPase